MKHYEYISRPYISPVNLETLGKTLNTLEQGHQQAVAQSSQLKLELAKLPLNEAEEGFRNELLSQIESTINNNSLDGNAYYALDNITKLSGDVLSDRRLLTRVQAQEDYKAYQDYIDKTDLPENYKAIYRAENQYYNNEEIDPTTGKVTKYTSWNPTSRPTQLSDMGRWRAEAYQIAAREKGSYDSIYYKDSQGNYTTLQEASVDNIPYYKVGTQYERLPEENISAALMNIINNTPGARESLNQDFKVAKWEHKDGQIDNATDDSGILLNSLDDYINKQVNGYAESVAYNHIYSNWNALAGLSVTNLINSKADGNTSKLSVASTIGESYIPKQSAISSIMASKNAAFSTLFEFAKNRNVKIGNKLISSIPIGKLTAEQINDAIQYTSENITDNEKKQIWMTYNQYLDYEKQYNEKIANLSEDDKNKIEFITAIQNNIDLSTYTNIDENGNSYYENPYFTKYINIINKLFGNKNEIKSPIKDINNDTELSYILPNYKELGLKIEDGKIIIPKTTISNLYTITKSLENYLSSTQYTTTHYPLSPTYINHDSTYPSLQPILTLYNNTSESVFKLVDNNSKLYTPTIYTVDEVSQMMIDNGNYANAETAKKDITNKVIESINQSGKANIQMGIGYQSSENSVPVNYSNTANNRNLAIAIFNQIASLNDGKNVQIGIDSQTLEQQITIHISEGMAYVTKLQEAMGWEEYPHTIILRGDFLTTDYKNQMLASPIFKYDQEKGRIINGEVKSIPIIEDLDITLENENGNLILKNSVKYDYGNGEYATKFLDARNAYRNLQFDFDNNFVFTGDNEEIYNIMNMYSQLLYIANAITPNIKTININGSESYDEKKLRPTVRRLYDNLNSRIEEKRRIPFNEILKIVNQE